MKRAKIILDKGIEKEILLNENETILASINSGNIKINSLCSGEGICGKCKLIIKSGKIKTTPTSLLSKDEIENNYILACRSKPLTDLEILIPSESKLGRHQILEHFIEEGEFSEGKKVLTENGKIGIAIDVGTTTIVSYFVDLTNGNIVDITSDYNKQILLGEDVLTRINHANKSEKEKKKLQALVLETINGLIEKSKIGKENLGRIEKIVFSGNTAMTYLLLGLDANLIKTDINSEDFRKPYTIDNSKELGLSVNSKLYSLPGIGGWVGGDIIADIIASKMCETENISMLIDVGTNGEIALGNSEFLIACSTSAGPAFEGGEVSSGMRAMRGAIEEIKITNDLEIEYATIDNAKPLGICGSGLIDLISELFLNEIIDYKGKFTDKIKEKEFVVVKKEETGLGRDIKISEKDIENIIRSKGAIYAGASTLTKVGTSFEDIDKIYIAGGFGYFLDIEKGIIIGLLPDIEKNKFKFIGNGAIKGAQMVLTSEDAKKEAEEIAQKTTYLDLIKDKNFTEEYMNALYIPHLDIERFPSVEEKIN